MNYQVWIKEEFGDNWRMVPCGDLEAAKREVEKAVRAGGEPILTQEVYYAVSIKLTEVKVETKKGETKPDQDTRVKSDGKVRRGDEGAAEKLDQGSGGDGSSTGAGD